MDSQIGTDLTDFFPSPPPCPPLLGLPAREQFRAFDSAPYQSRKAIITTNIAETSVTIAGVCYGILLGNVHSDFYGTVIDCGFVKMRVFSPKLGMETLMIVPCSKSSAEQRAGRAGRVRPGKCYRLYAESEFRRLRSATPPEIQRCDLSSVVLRMKALGVQNVLRWADERTDLNAIEKLRSDSITFLVPSSMAMVHALQLLFALKAIDEDGLLVNPLGLLMAELPLSSNAREGTDCLGEIVTIIAMMQIRDVFVMPTGAKHKAELSRRSFAVDTTVPSPGASRISSITKRCAVPRPSAPNSSPFCRTMPSCASFPAKAQLATPQRFGARCSADFFSQIAYYDHTGLYVTVKGEHSFKVYKGSVLMYRKEYPKWVLFTDVMQNSIRDLSEIDPAWLEHIAPHYYEFGSNLPDGSRRKAAEEESNFAEGRLANLN
ncbi:hypothetical protein niasHT_017376 [Heterodera trifolii]|uniref:Helicase C-terminal domain-containing protein n=1 Tax=Heterodera trifolii TaxID=157864 RepID=A0ABD2L446_9BILA